MSSSWFGSHSILANELAIRICFGVASVLVGSLSKQSRFKATRCGLDPLAVEMVRMAQTTGYTNGYTVRMTELKCCSLKQVLKKKPKSF